MISSLSYILLKLYCELKRLENKVSQLEEENERLKVVNAELVKKNEMNAKGL